jgi:hypothetical protein
MITLPMAVVVPMTTVVIVTYADTHWAYLNADHCRIRCRDR